MARGDKNKNENTEPVSENTDEVTTGDSTGGESSGEGTDAAAKPADQGKSDKPAEEPIDLTAFQKVASDAVAERDEATGELAAAVVERVRVSYRELPHIKAKNAAKKWLADQVENGMNAMDLPIARAWMTLKNEMTTAASGGGSKEPKAPVDPTEAYVNSLATLELAFALLQESVPEGVEAEAARDREAALVAELEESLPVYRDWLVSTAEDKGDEPKVSDVVKAAVNLALGKRAKVVGRVKSAGGGGSTHDGPRRDIGKHIQEAFADKEPGTFMTVAEIKKFKSSEYGDDSPSAGAISARLFPASGRSTVEGVESVSDPKKGARKAA